MEFAMLSQLFYTRTVHSKPSGELKSNVAYCNAELDKITTLALVYLCNKDSA